MDIRLFLWTHPWWHAAAVLFLPLLVGAFFSWRELRHSAGANRLRKEANDSRAEANRLSDEANGLRTEANRLREEQRGAVVRIAELQDERNQLEGERNRLMEKIAENTRRPLSQAEKNALKLRKYLRKLATVSEGNGNWGAMGAEIVDVSEDNILTLFVPAGYSSTSAYVVYVHCDELQIVEEPVGSCALQIKILKRYGDTLQLGEIRKWEDRRTPSTAPLPRGGNVFHADYSQGGSSKRRGIYIYAPTEGNPQYTLVTLDDGKETGVLYGGNVEISKKFAVLQVGYHAEGFRYGGGGTGASADPLFLFTH